jgi:hypothetical protein
MKKLTTKQVESKLKELLPFKRVDEKPEYVKSIIKRLQTMQIYDAVQVEAKKWQMNTTVIQYVNHFKLYFLKRKKDFKCHDLNNGIIHITRIK